ncbi:lipopolysaccharide biosynthesis protein [Clostridium perfringens]|uniref:lipopolysaccharide biosynthesis protein n=1 Tax=Clostridium perfringens TaxID=1502 RepID=UPI002A5B8FF4|nr:polysaccharide biosynthesis C-terminal domain-containing protein [Clostridium perfringens]
MRGKKAIKNSVVSITYQFISMICAFIVPRLILSHFGSSYNGLNSAILQFLNCIVLLRAGISSVTRFALYKPLAEKDNKKISEILFATKIFMRKVALIFSIILISLAIIYPIFVREEFDWIFTFLLILIMGIGTIIQNYFGLTYQMLLIADQKGYIFTSIQIITTILNTIVTVILINIGTTFNMIKLASTTVFVLNPILLTIYVNKNYNIIKDVKPDFKVISQRWEAFAQEVAAFVNNNTDLMILSIFLNIKEVSVYTVYYLVINGVKTIIICLSEGFASAFGNMLAKNEKKLLLENMKIYEFMIYSISVIAFTSTAILIVPFISIYTKGINDINYSRPIFGLLVAIGGFFYCVKFPYQDIIQSHGYFKENRNSAIIESIINILISIIFVKSMGLIGVTIGTICALLFRMIQYSRFSCKHILKISFNNILKRFAVCLLEVFTIFFVFRMLPKFPIENYLTWSIYAFIILSISSVIVFIYKFIFYNRELKMFITKICSYLKIDLRINQIS